MESPISVRIWENYNVYPSPRQQHTYKPTNLLSLVMLTDTGTPKNLQNCHQHSQHMGKVTWQMRNRSLLEATGGITQMQCFYLPCVKIFKLTDTYFFDFKGQSFNPVAHGNQLPLSASKFPISLTFYKIHPSPCSSISTKSKQMYFWLFKI